MGVLRMSGVSDVIVGIDLGTTNSLVAFCDERGPRVLLDDDIEAGGDVDGHDRRANDGSTGGSARSSGAAGPSPLIPSVVLYRPGGPPIVGRAARAARLDHPREAIWSVKRLMGRSLREVAGVASGLPYRVVEGARGMACVAPLGAPITPQEVSAEILRRLRRRAERALGRPVRRAVVTVPAYFDDAQRQATRDAGRLAGLDVVRVVNEPTAAALAYGIGLDILARAAPEPAARDGTATAAAERSRATTDAGALDDNDRTVAVYDLGGGTFDVSILRVLRGAPSGPDRGGALAGDGLDDRRAPATEEAGIFFQVLATAGDTRLGGDDLDALLADELARRVVAGERGDSDPSPRPGDAEGGPRREVCERPPESLAGVPADGPGHPDRAGSAVRPEPNREALRAAAEAAKIALSAEELTTVRVDAAAGAGGLRIVDIDRATLESLAAPLIDRTLACCRRALADARLPVSAIHQVVLVGGMTRMPLVRRAVAEFFGRTPYTALDPDQVVALGAAVQGSIIAGLDRRTLLLDVIPLSLGIETVGGAVAKLIMRNSSVPSRAREMFSTSVDGQVSVKVHVVQGEREMVRDCRSLGEFHLRGIPPMPAGIPQIEVEFLVDANGILDVTAMERRSGRRASIQVVPAHGLTREEVDRMERESYVHARDDMHAHRVIDLVVNAQLDMKWIGEALDRVRGELDPAYVGSIDGMLAALRRMVDAARADPAAADADALHRAKQELDVASVRMHEVAIAKSLRNDARA